MKLGCLFDPAFRNDNFINLLKDQSLDIMPIKVSENSKIPQDISHVLAILDYHQKITPEFEKHMHSISDQLGQDKLVLVIAHQVEGQEKEIPVAFKDYRYLEYTETLESQIACLFSLCRKLYVDFTAIPDNADHTTAWHAIDEFAQTVYNRDENLYIIPQLVLHLYYEFQRDNSIAAFQIFTYLSNLCNYYGLELPKLVQSHFASVLFKAEDALYFNFEQVNEFHPHTQTNQKHAKNNCYTFVSFSSKDKKYAQDIMAGLSLHHIPFWDYSNQVEEIDASEKIPDRLEREIEKCKYFIILVSKNSVDPNIGRFTRKELQNALELKKHHHKSIIPIYLPDKPQNMDALFSQIIDLHPLEYIDGDEREYEMIIRALCDKFNIEYQPLLSAHERLPFWKFFRQEIQQFMDSHSHILYQNSLHTRLNRMLAEFSTSYSQDDFHDAYFLITLFLQTLAYYVPQAHLFYPWIVKGVCERENGLHTRALKSYERAGEIRPNDENYFGGLGGTYFDMQCFDLAKKYYKKAIEVCPPEENTDEIINYVNCLLTLQEQPPLEYCNKILNISLDEYKGFQSKVLTTQGIIYYSRANFHKALNIFSSINKGKDRNTTTIGYHVNCLIQLSKTQEAQDLLNKALKWSYTNKKIDRAFIQDYLSKF